MLCEVTLAVSDLVESSEVVDFPKSTLLSLFSSVTQVMMAVPLLLGAAAMALITGGAKSGMIKDSVLPSVEGTMAAFCAESLDVTLKK